GAALLTCEDLCAAGWRYTPGEPERSTAVVSGQIVPVAEIAGVLTLRPAVVPDEFTSIAPADRQYVAGEINAFLVAWLAGLGCPVLNPRSPNCLSGPGWRAEQWTFTAAQCGIPVIPRARHIPPREAPAAGAAACAAVTVVGDAVIGAANETLAAHAR